jgi:hypothetical protein
MSELVRQMRQCAASKPSEFEPHWEDAARRLLLQAADTIDAADFALLDYCEQLRVAQERITGLHEKMRQLTYSFDSRAKMEAIFAPAESTEGKT